MRLGCLLVILCASPARADDPAWEKVQRTRTLQVALDFNIPQDTCLITRDRKTGKLGGLEIEFVEAMGRHLGAKVAWVQKAWEHLIEAVSDAKADIAVQEIFIPKSVDAASPVLYSKPYLSTGLALAHVSKPKPGSWQDFRKRKGGMYIDPGVERVGKALGFSSMQAFEEESDMFEALLAGRIDFVLYDRPLLKAFVDQNAKRVAMLPEKRGYLPGSEGDYGVVVKRGNQQLLEKVNGFIAGWRLVPEVRAKAEECGLFL